ncbi:ankyrin repeat-containing domain protein [Pelagophyceae sp. CCMP2097]|nr:ankyrin repeat-containing domain protein [Pelagophyceae sp. CCMP2097]
MKAHGRAAAAQLREAICAAYARHAFSRQLDLVQARVSTGRAQLRAAAVTPASVQAQRAAMGATHPWLGSMLKKAAFVEAAAMPNLKDKPNKGQGKAQPAAHKVGEEPEHVKMQMALASVADAVHDFEVELQAMRALLRKPADCGEALVSAAMLGHAAAAEHALQLGARPDATVNGPTALTWAAQRGDLDMVRLLLRARANPNVCGYRGFTPLLYATLHGYRDVARALEAAGADADLARTQLKKALKRTPVVKAPANDDAAHSWSLADGMAALVAAVGPV